jgi:SAM-dependent methyltransferase
MISAPAEDPQRFHVARPTGLRRARPTHRLAYIIWLLPRRLEALAGRLNVGPGDRVLDYGCAELPYRHFFDETVEFVGADLPGNPAAEVTIGADGTLPLPDDSVDAVLSTQVLEHVASPAVYLDECLRVLKPGGRLLLSTHGLMVYHPDPVDYWRWTAAGLTRALGTAGFTVVHREGIMGVGAVGLQFVQDAIYHRTHPRLRAAVAMVFQSLIATADRFAPPDAPGADALVHAVLAEKPSTNGRHERLG